MNRKLWSFVLASAALTSGCAIDFGAAPRFDLLGDPAPVTAATDVIVLTPDTTYVNVIGGQTVRFRLGEKEFAWSFDGPAEVDHFDLRRVSPPGFFDHALIAYIAPNPLYTGRGHHSRR